METALFDYHLDAAAIAQQPIEPRHDARLLDTRTMTDHRFLEIGELLSPGDLVVVNTARVRRARPYRGRGAPRRAVQVVMLPDRGDVYLSKLYNDEWMRDNGFLAADAVSIRQILSRKSTQVPMLVSVDPSVKVRDALHLLEGVVEPCGFDAELLVQGVEVLGLELRHGQGGEESEGDPEASL